MGWRDLLNPTPVEFVEKAEFVPAGNEEIPLIPQIPPSADSVSPDLTLLDQLTEAEREYYHALLEIMESPKFGMDRKTAEQEAGLIITQNRQPLQIKQAAKYYQRYGYIKIFSVLLNQAVYLVRDELAVKRVPDQRLPVYTEAELECLQGLKQDEAKTIMEGKLVFGGSIITKTR